MTDHEQVVTCLDSKAHRLVKTVVIEDRAHIEIIGHDEPLKAKVIFEQFRDNLWREGSRAGDFIEARDGNMADHH